MGKQIGRSTVRVAMAVVITPALLMLWLHKLFKEIYKLPCPVTAIHMDGEWAILYLKPHLMRVPSLNTQRVATQGFYNSDGKRINIAVWDMPEFFFHGTSVEGLLGTLKDGTILGSHEIGEPPKSPAGVYSYGNSDRSDVSTYVAQGVQIRFRNPSIAPSAANCSLFPTVPEGLIIRQGRSVYRKHGAVGWEWIHNSQSIQVLDARCKSELFYTHLVQICSSLPRPIEAWLVCLFVLSAYCIFVFKNVLFPFGSLFETTKALIIISEFIVCLVRNYNSLREWLDYYKPERTA